MRICWNFNLLGWMSWQLNRLFKRKGFAFIFSICVLGDRLLSAGNYTCSKNESDPLSLHHIFCSEINKTDTGEPFYDCDPYFQNNEVSVQLGIPGLASDVFHCKFYHLYSLFSYKIFIIYMYIKNFLLFTCNYFDVEID